MQREGKLIGVLDTQIAGICLSHNLPLLTRNTDHFQRVPGLELISPEEIAP
ncbi:MAG: type II toxin-antitoxin system VapC family toxin [Anaerolineales bacterium]|nr:type II toxin-antitoxin system VapC family toxin [Chloroflexota bacterium]MBL7163392.1 type II toxin-antitoxin system VapC family toxin [Anaerolineales bacterium]